MDKTARDFIIDCELPNRKEGEPLSMKAENQLLESVYTLPLWFRKSLHRIGNTGGGLQLVFRFARVLTRREYFSVLNGFKAFLAAYTWVDPTSFNLNQCQRLIGTVNHKYGVTSHWLEDSLLEVLRSEFVPGNPSHVIEGLKRQGFIKESRGPGKKRLKKALDFIQGATLRATDLAKLVVLWGQKRWRLNLDRLPIGIGERVRLVLQSGESKFNRGELYQFENFKFLRALKEAVVQSMTIEQLLTLKQVPRILKTSLQGKQVTCYSNLNQPGRRRKEIVLGYKIAKLLRSLIDSLPRKRRRNTRQNSSFDVLDIALAGLIQGGYIHKEETYESAWKRALFYLAEVVGLIQPREQPEKPREQPEEAPAADEDGKINSFAQLWKQRSNYYGEIATRHKESPTRADRRHQNTRLHEGKVQEDSSMVWTGGPGRNRRPGSSGAA